MSEILHAEPTPELTWQAEDVIREVDHRPHLVVRITVRGRHFPQRALVPFMRIVQGDTMVARDWFTEITADSQALVGYFATDLPREGVIEYGYFPQILGRVRARFEATAIKRLDRSRVGREVIEATTEYLRRRRGEL
jgi:hypothetical protein